jgi:hypothetical protein
MEVVWDAATGRWMLVSFESSASSGADLWHYIVDGGTGQNVLTPDPLAVGALSPSDFVVALPAQSTEGAGTRMMFVQSSGGAFRSGIVTGAAWDAANRGATSAAFGLDNLAFGAQSFIGGGELNAARGVDSMVGAGKSNLVGVAATSGFIGAGESNQVINPYGAVVGGTNHVVNSANAFIGGGDTNLISPASTYSAIVAGNANTVGSLGTFIGGGNANVIGVAAAYAVIGGGQSNSSNSAYDFIGGGFGNVSGASYSVIAGGKSNSATTNYGAICGGESCVVGDHAFVGSGISNNANVPYGVVCGGQSNTVFHNYGFVGGGQGNSAFAILGEYGAVVGGLSNVAGNVCFVGGGSLNIGIGSYCAIGGGKSNATDLASEYSGVFTGQSCNAKTCVWSTVAGGFGNNITGDAAGRNETCFIAGGSSNNINGTAGNGAKRGIIVGGTDNTITDGSAGGMVCCINSQAVTVSNAVLVATETSTITSCNDSTIMSCNASSMTSSATSAIIAGTSNTMTGRSNVAILGGASITAVQDNTAYGQRLTTFGGRQVALVATTVSLLLTLDHHMVVLTPTGLNPAVTITLPTTPPNGQEYYVKNWLPSAGPDTLSAGAAIGIIDNTGATVAALTLVAGTPVHVVYLAASNVWLQL